LISMDDSSLIVMIMLMLTSIALIELVILTQNDNYSAEQVDETVKVQMFV